METYFPRVSFSRDEKMKTLKENQKIAQIRKLKLMNKKLLNIVSLIEKKDGKKLKLFCNNSFYDRCEEYIDKNNFGVSNFYYSGTSSEVDCLFGVELHNNNFHFVFRKLYIFANDEVKKFIEFQDFFVFLKERGKIELLTTQTKKEILKKIVVARIKQIPDNFRLAKG